MGGRLCSVAAGVAQTLGIVAAFVGAGLAWSALASGGAGEPYPGRVMAATQWLVDGFNVIQVGLLAGRDRDGWWQEARRAELLERAGHLGEPDAEVWVVFDGPHPENSGSGRARAVFAPSADAWVLERLRAAPEPAQVRVVTADRRLAERARRRGARVVAPAAFLARCGTGGSG